MQSFVCFIQQYHQCFFRLKCQFKSCWLVALRYVYNLTNISKDTWSVWRTYLKIVSLLFFVMVFRVFCSQVSWFATLYRHYTFVFLFENNY